MWYRYEIEVNAAGNNANFKIYNDTTGQLLLDVNNTTNIPTTLARACGVGLVATESSTTASDVLVLTMMGFGTIAGFNKARN